MDRVEAIIRGAYEARTRGDLDAVMRHFADGATFSLSGSPAASPVPTAASGRAAIREVLRRLLEGFEFSQMKPVTILVDGERAAVHWHVKVRAVSSGYEAETDILDLVRVQDGKITDFRQFADTALINRMIGA